MDVDADFMMGDVNFPSESESEFSQLVDRVDAIDEALAKNTAATLEGNRDMREILEIIQAVRGGLKVLGWLGAAVKWVAGIAAAVGALWTLWNQMHKS